MLKLVSSHKKVYWNYFYFNYFAVVKELKEAFRLYDKEGNGYIPTSCLKEILRELDDQLSDSDLDGMIAEIDQGKLFLTFILFEIYKFFFLFNFIDGSGTVDFDEWVFFFSWRKRWNFSFREWRRGWGNLIWVII